MPNFFRVNFKLYTIIMMSLVASEILMVIFFKNTVPRMLAAVWAGLIFGMWFHSFLRRLK